MSKSNKGSTNKIRNVPEPGGPKPESAPKVKRVRAHAIEKNETGSHTVIAKNQNKAKTEHPQTAIKQLNTHSDSDQNVVPEAQMEVQHHPQLDHNPKPWKEYLLEGFMIFIAVMMGFIAENVRETITNSQHVKQLTYRLVQDLKVDTVQLDKAYRFESKIIKSNDTLFDLLKQPLANADTKRIQHFVTDSHSMWPFHPSAVSIAAIKNELYLKQFSDSEIISYIATYEKDIDLLHTVQDITLKYQRSFLDPFLLAHFTPANLEAAFHHSSIPTTQMRNLTQESLTQLGASMVLVRINTHELLDDNRQLKNDADSLLQYVTRQYHLKE